MKYFGELGGTAKTFLDILSQICNQYYGMTMQRGMKGFNAFNGDRTYFLNPPPIVIVNNSLRSILKYKFNILIFVCCGDANQMLLLHRAGSVDVVLC